jgi:hypothetical protein
MGWVVGTLVETATAQEASQPREDPPMGSNDRGTVFVSFVVATHRRAADARRTLRNAGYVAPLYIAAADGYRNAFSTSSRTRFPVTCPFLKNSLYPAAVRAM